MEERSWYLEYQNDITNALGDNALLKSINVDTSWIVDRPWIYIDHIMRIVLPKKSVYPIVANILDLFEETEYHLNGRYAKSHFEIFEDFSKIFSENTGVIDSDIERIYLTDFLLKATKTGAFEYLENIKLAFSDASLNLVATNTGFVFLNGTSLSSNKVRDIVYLILEKHNRDKDFSSIANKIKRHFQIVILHRRAPLLVKKLK